ncbi:sensor histidine kinase [Glycomyces salinus]|uniref:sensor histidine kinase n=1 Tax=Glycomyces salinus TaxID=980294 RepID=UPI0018EDBBAD|nr:ATP-binding protein [Glycomyces salinus]
MAPWFRALPRSAFIALGAAAASVAYTALILGGRAPVLPVSWVLVEPAALTVLFYAAARWSRPRPAACAAAAVLTALVSMMFRFLDGPWWEPLAGGVAWSFPALTLGALAVYQRAQERLRERAIARARDRQRIELAHDLHDFAAHDISEVVAQAQAGRVTLAGGDERVTALLERIERAGLRALGSMDRTVGLLRGPDDADTAPPGGVDRIAELVDRFNEAGSPTARLQDDLTGSAERDTGAVAHRLVSEALTNVRRHASGAAEVRVELRGSGRFLTVAVTDDGRAGPRRRHRARSGLGLTGLTARVEALGGTLTAGPVERGGWRVEARLPTSDFEPEGADR